MVKRSTKKTIRRKAKTQPKYGKKRPYKSASLRTLQLATQRPATAMLKFQKHMCYRVKPKLLGGTTQQMCHIQLCANSIYNMLLDYSPQQTIHDTVFQEQDFDYILVGAPSSVAFNANGYDDWKERFQKFVVIGSKITVTYEPVIDSEGSAGLLMSPTTLFIQKSQTLDNGITATTSNSGDICKLPYVNRAQILTARIGRSGKGGAVSSTFSAKKDFGVKDYQDNPDLFGNLDANDFPNNGPAMPTKQCYYNIYLAETVKKHTSLDQKPLVEGIMRIKIDYLVRLSDPSNTNKQTVDGTTAAATEGATISRLVDEL